MPFRGIDTAWFGDFSQLPPVGEQTLYAKLKKESPPPEAVLETADAISKNQRTHKKAKTTKKRERGTDHA